METQLHFLEETKQSLEKDLETTKSTVESLESQLHQTTEEKEQLDQSLNDRISTLQSDLDSLRADKQLSEEELQQQILLLKVNIITKGWCVRCHIYFPSPKEHFIHYEAKV